MLRGMAQANIDLGVFQETKCTDGIYTRASAGYRVIATNAPSRHRGGVALFYRTEAQFAVEEVRVYGPRVLSFEVVARIMSWVSDGHVHEEKAISPQEVVRPRLYDLPFPYHASHPTFPPPSSLPG